MARHKSARKKRYLLIAKRKNKRIPVWVVMKTQDRSKMGKPTRNWRQNKIGHKIYRKMNELGFTHQIMLTGTRRKRRKTRRRD